jgi:non-heme chloroperoxidase
LIHGAQYLVYEGAPHGLFYTHKDRLNEDLIKFIKANNTASASNNRKGVYANTR